ncbi:MAG TPA: hypothetical protein VG733_08465 [Chthoniobacteraceae bacterium]|nr:hypothetical protein [Chthoniobacteraceae bacterium]
MASLSANPSPDTLSPHTPVTNGPEWQKAAEAGWDMTLLAESIRMTPWQRIQQHRSALSLATMLRDAMVKSHA